MKTMKIVAICLSFLLFTGCVKYTEIDKLAFVVAIGIDKDKQDPSKYLLTLQVVNPSQIGSTTGSGGSQGLPVVNYTGVGRTPSEATRVIAKKMSREAFYGHLALVVIAEDVAKEDILKVFDVFERDVQVRAKTPVVLAKNSTAHELLKALDPVQKITALSILEKLKNTHQQTGEISLVSTLRIIDFTTRPGSDLFLVGVQIPSHGKVISEDDELKQSEPLAPKINGVGLFRQGKLVGWLDGRQTRVLSLVANELQKTDITFFCDRKNKASVSILKMKTKQDVTVQKGKPVIQLTVTGRGILEETNCHTDLSDPKTIVALEQQAGNMIKKEIEQVMKINQKYGVDVFSSGYKLYTTSSDVWKKVEPKWREMLKTADLQIQVKIRIANTSMRSNTSMYDQKGR